MATVMVPAIQPFMRSTARAMKKKAIGSSAIRLDNHRLPAGSYTCCQGCMRALDRNRRFPTRWGRRIRHYWSYHFDQ
ncbi:hypothetical protein D3C73_1534190 [compost metagenome]